MICVKQCLASHVGCMYGQQGMGMYGQQGMISICGKQCLIVWTNAPQATGTMSHRQLAGHQPCVRTAATEDTRTLFDCKHSLSSSQLVLQDMLATLIHGARQRTHTHTHTHTHTPCSSRRWKNPRRAEHMSGSHTISTAGCSRRSRTRRRAGATGW